MRNLDSKKILFSLMVLSLFIFVLIFVLKQPSLMDKDDPPASLRSMDFLTAAPCSPKRHVMFLKTHKTGSTTVQNMMLRHTDEAKLKLAVPVKKVLKHKDTFYFSIIRNTVNQMESSFSYFKRSYPAFKAAPSLEDFLNNTSKYHNARHLRNSRVKNPTWFDFGYNNRQNFSEEQYTKALREIERSFNLILITEYFDESMILLKEFLCWDIDDVVTFKHNSRNE
ncbi:hypothetical protein JZ751_012692, partial [Albula glossodonta]